MISTQAFLVFLSLASFSYCAEHGVQMRLTKKGMEYSKWTKQSMYFFLSEVNTSIRKYPLFSNKIIIPIKFLFSPEKVFVENDEIMKILFM